MRNKSENSYYVAWSGNGRVIYSEPWEKVKHLIEGVSGIHCEGFKTKEEADHAFSLSYEEYLKWKNRGDGIEFPALW